jgi:hypothetical protein
VVAPLAARLPSAKLQSGKGLEAVFLSGPTEEVPPRQFGTSIALVDTIALSLIRRTFNE